MTKVKTVRVGIAAAAFAGLQMMSTVVASAEAVQIADSGSSFSGSSFAAPSGSGTSGEKSAQDESGEHSDDERAGYSGSSFGSSDLTVGELVARLLFGVMTGS